MEDHVDNSLLNRLLGMFEEAEEASNDANELARRCRNYFDGEQLSAEEVEALEKRGQPPLVLNHIRKEVNWMRGYEQQSKTDPKAYPREPNAADAAEAATDALRFVADNVDYRKKRSKAWENLVIEGVCGVEVIHRQVKSGDIEVVVNRYAPDRIFYDPHSAEDDFSDARYKGVVIWADMDQVIKDHPDSKDAIEASIGVQSNTSDLFDDKPYWSVWSDPKRRRVRVCLVYYREDGVWKWAKYTKGGVLEDGESPYVDENGESDCPLILQSMYVGAENDRHGVVKDFLDPQDEVNKRRSKLLHQMNSRQTWGVKGAVNSVAGMKKELAKPDGHVEVTKEAALDAAETGVAPFNIIPNGDQSSGQFQLLMESKGEIERMGANSALMGQGSASSGRQVMAEQQGGLVEIAPIYAQILNFDMEVYRHMWMRVRQFWTGQKWIRVTDDEKNLKFVGLNQPVTLQDKLSELPREEVVMIAQQMQLTPDDPRLNMPVDMKNSVEQMDVDIIIDDAPDSVTLQSETFEQLVSMASSMPGSIPPEILIEYAPGFSRDVKDKLREAMEQNKMMQMQGRQAASQAEAQKGALEAMQAEAKAAKDMADAQQTQVETAQMVGSVY